MPKLRLSATRDVACKRTVSSLPKCATNCKRHKAPDDAETTLQAERERTVRSLPTLRLSATRDPQGSANGKQLMCGELKAERETERERTTKHGA